MELVFISGPYRAKTINRVVQNIRIAEVAAIKYWLKGYAIICAHKNSALLDGVAPDETWLKGYLEILSRCDVIVMVPGWEKSEYSIKEHNFAISKSIKVIYESNTQI